jgi:hypothetical protein
VNCATTNTGIGDNEMDYTMIDDMKVHNELIKFRDFLAQKHMNLLFKPQQTDRARNNEKVSYFEVYYDYEPEFRVGSIGFDSQNKKWWIGGVYPKINMNWNYESPDNVRSSVHMKNLNKFVKDIFVFPDIKMYARCNTIYAMNNHINSYRNNNDWSFHQETHGLPDETFDDFKRLHEMGFEPVSDEFKRIIKAVVEQGAEILERKKYNPEYYHVWVRKSGITYMKLDNNDFIIPEEKVVKTRAELPMLIQEKMAILDLLEISHELHEDIGAKEQPDFYTVFA